MYMLYGVGVGGLNWRVPAGLFTWNQHERVLSVLMQLFCAFHCKVWSVCMTWHRHKWSIE